jgi:hypothetical protein
MGAWIIFDYLGEDFIFFRNRLSLSWLFHGIILLSILTRIVGFIFEATYIYGLEKEQAKI